MSLTKSIPVKAGTPLIMRSARTQETIFEYNVPDEYNAIIHIVVDLFPKPTGIYIPKSEQSGGKH